LNPDRITIAGSLAALLTIALFTLIVVQSPFPVFKFASSSDRFINVQQDIGPKDSVFMWTDRTLDLIAQAFVIFAAAAGSLAILRTARKEEDAND
jgi:hypothetical protein